MYLHIGNQLQMITFTTQIVNVFQILFNDYCTAMNSSSIWV